MPLAITDAFAELSDPRIDRKKQHLLIDTITNTLCATICGCETREQIAAYGRAKEAWLKTFLKLPNGIPSRDTFRRVFGPLDRRQFWACPFRWT